MRFGYRLCLITLPLVLLGAALPIAGSAADPPANEPPATAARATETPPTETSPTGAAAHKPPALPLESVVHHSMALPGRTLAFTTAAGTIRPTDARGEPLANIAVVAYTLDGTDPATRPVTFVLNGGPGMASGWLQVGAVGPWIIPLNGDAGLPSAPPTPAPNADTWLDFTDLVFIDPAGTGYSRAIATGEKAQHALFSVDGDIDYLAQVIRRWLDKSARIVSPKFILGESYGGFRAPRLARVLQHDEGVGVSGIIALSPALDFGGRSGALDPLLRAMRLPSMTAAVRAAKGPVTRGSLADVEQYAAGDFIADLLRGVRDDAAVDRLVQHVAAFTGLDPALVARYRGRIDMDVFLHEIDRGQRRVASPYDATVSGPDPFPLDPQSDYEEPVVQALIPPITSAMVALYDDQLHWRPETIYRLSNVDVFRRWDWQGTMTGGAQSVDALRVAMALDPHMRVLVAHGLYDLLTPYFGTVLILRQVPELGAPDRIRLVVYPGGHMFYSQPASRAAFRDEGRKVISGD